MAEGFLKSLDSNLRVSSAGTNPSLKVHPKAIQVMYELGIDISHGKPENIDQYLNDEWDHVVTVCDHAKETCPVFTGKVKQQLHIGFEDPAEAIGTEEEILSEFRRIRNEIIRDFTKFYREKVKPLNKIP